MTFKLLLICTILILISCGEQSEEEQNERLDAELAEIISENDLSALSSPGPEPQALVSLGEKLFSDNALSGNRNISCMTCHHTDLGTSDALPLSIGTGATGIGLERKQINGSSVAVGRNSPALFNLGRNGQTHSFFDGRVNFNNNQINSPVNEINGNRPSRLDIKNIFENVYDVQPLFPLLSVEEMLGSGNNLSNQVGEVSIWEAILFNRILNQAEYVTLFQDAFPATAINDFNPGHIGRAIGAFMKIKFAANQTRFDRYLAGDLNALSLTEKRGMRVFYGRGRCHTCHSGNLLTDENFESIAVPQIGFTPFQDDLGLEAFTGDSRDRYFYKTPSLRNIALTAPYMHNGAFQNLPEVIRHYNNIGLSLNNYRLPASYQSHYEQSLVVDQNSARNQNRLNQADGRLRRGLRLSAEEQNDLIQFLQNALTDESFRGR